MTASCRHIIPVTIIIDPRVFVFTQIELYRRDIWRDAKTVNVISNGCFATEAKVIVTALRFFLGENNDPDVEEV